jgi:uncharacterized protein
MSLKRRHFLMFLGASAGSLTLGSMAQTGQKLAMPFQTGAAQAATPGGLSFEPIKGPMPLMTDSMAATEQKSLFSTYEVVDDLVLPEGFTYDVIAAWGDPVGDSRFGTNNDYISFIETSEGEGYLVVNHEYVSSLPWSQGFEQVVGKSIPIEAVTAAAEAASEDGIDAYTLPDDDPIKAQIREVSVEALIDQGLSVISIRKNPDGRWVRTNSNADRRVTGASGLDDNRYLKTTGPAALVFRKSRVQGYSDGLGDRIIGTFGNCSGGTTPWGTVLSAEENFQDQVPEPVYADGSSMSPSDKLFLVDEEGVGGQGNVLGLAGNKYGWIVEIDPANPSDFGTKHSWLGRYRHEAVGVRAEAGKQLAFYSGCDRRGGHVYKFVSRDPVRDPRSKSNSRLLANGMLYAAKFNEDGTGTWIPLAPDTPVNPDMPSMIEGGLLPLPLRPDGGVFKADSDEAVAQFKQRFSTIGQLYTGTEQERQGAILIDAHYAANAAGATATARPEDTDVRPDGTLFITFTSGSPGSDGGPDKRIFKGPKGETNYEYGWIMRLNEDNNDPAAMSFTWENISLGGEPADGGLGFANPDNLEIDANGNLWMVTDMSTDKHNVAVPSRIDEEGEPVSQSNLRGLFGNNSIWFIPTSGPDAGKAYLFGLGPMDSETTGPFFTRDQQTLFLAVQHPGEIGGIRQNGASETRQFAMKTTEGEEFMQSRVVPIGSNWPTKAVNAPPKSAVVAIRRVDGGSLT